MPQTQRPERKIHVVASHVGNVAATKVPPLTPVRRYVTRMIGPFGSRTKPLIPVNVRRDRRHIRWAIASTPTATCPTMHFSHFADRTRLNQLNHSAVVSACVDLRTHLRRDFHLRRGFC